MKKTIFILFLLLFYSCGSVNKVLESTNVEFKRKKAFEFFTQKNYEDANRVFESIVPYYRSTSHMEEIRYTMAMCSYHMKLYILAAEQLGSFAKRYPQNPKTEKVAYLSAYCYYLDSPLYYLDQKNTGIAIDKLQAFVNKYPNSSYVKDANNLVVELRTKLERKAYEGAKIYYTIKEYKAAIVAFRSVLNDYPGSKFTEDILYYKLKAAYLYAIKSIKLKEKERLVETETAYREFKKKAINPDYIEDANKIYKEIKFRQNEI